jgi:hypothetical protein
MMKSSERRTERRLAYHWAIWFAEDFGGELAQSQMADVSSRVGELDVRVRMHLDLARTALAAERYRLATGKLPQRLEDLTPQYLAQVPIDPFDGQPLRYRFQQPGYLLYSVFEDGQDNGGKERADVGRGEPYDWCFRVTR